MSGHPHADLMAKAAEIAKTDKEWWKHFEIKTLHFDAWSEMCNEIFFDNDEYRLKPRYIDINGHQVPEPVRDPLEVDNLLWIADITQLNAEQLMWTGHTSDILMLERGILHLTKEAAEAHIAALLSFTQK
ncbi:hypothetical protein ABMZ91_03275 [Morganella morganii]|uniref:hypothetical protein n=2 Tax=Morganella morganii TaxID=582 RepID=UPI000D8E2EC1|nr:hypothetical protein [Morganella morganii]SPX92418.1 Uncharacterised protein [Morganella morganii]